MVATKLASEGPLDDDTRLEQIGLIQQDLQVWIEQNSVSLKETEY